jgi:hypothetical protein
MNPEPVRKRFSRPVPVSGVYPWEVVPTCDYAAADVIPPEFG